MGDKNGSKQMSVGDMQALQKTTIDNLPAYIEAINKQAAPTERAKLEAAQSTNADWQKLGADTTAADVTSSNALLKGQGGDYAKTLANLSQLLDQQSMDQGIAAQKKLDQPFYDQAGNAINRLDDASWKAKDAYNNSLNARAANNKGIDNAQALLNTYNLNGLSGGEAAAAERGINRSNIASGNTQAGDPLSTVNNAMMFGDVYDKKRAGYNTALASFNQALANFNQGTNNVTSAAGGYSAAAQGLSSFLPQLKSGLNVASFRSPIDVGSAVLGRPITQARGQYGDVGSQAASLGSGLQNTNAGILQSNIAKRTDGFDKFNSIMSGLGSLVSV